MKRSTWNDALTALRLTDPGEDFDLSYDPHIDDEALALRTACL